MKNWERKHLREEKNTKYTSSGEMLKWMSMTSSIGAVPLRKERPWLGILAGNSLSFANFDYLSFDSNFLEFRLAITMKIHLRFASKPLTSIKEVLLDQVWFAFLKSFIKGQNMKSYIIHLHISFVYIKNYCDVYLKSLILSTVSLLSQPSGTWASIGWAWEVCRPQLL